MTHNHRSNQRNVRSPKSTSALGLTAAVLALLAGAPAGYAQSSEDEAGQPGGFGSLMNFLGAGGEQPQNGSDPAGEAPAQADGEAEFRTDGVYYDENATIELHAQDEDLRDVLQMLSIESERNIVTSSDVNARVTANLYGVTFHEALDAILHVNGYGYIERGNFIYVYPIDVLEQIEQASRQMTSRVIRLNFLSAVDAADFVTPLLSESGEIKSNGKASAWTEPTTPMGNEEFANESTLVVYDFAENIDAIESLLTELDTRPAQILVEATIVQTTVNEQNAFGVDFSIIGDLDFAEFVNPLGAVDALIDGGSSGEALPEDGEGRGVVSNPGNTSGPATFKAGIVDNDVAVFLRMLDQVTDTTIISNPKVVTLNRQPGRVLVGRKVGYLQTTATDTATTQTVEFLDTGTQLNFRPFVTNEGIIRMELKPQVSEAALRSATDASGVAVTIPDEITNELIANVLVPDGHTIVLGGLFRESTTATRRQVPVLGDIPILGAAFRGHDDDVQRQEIIFLITPSIVSDQVLVDQGLRGEDAIRRVRAGAREGTLPFSRSRQAAQLLVEAEHLEAEGKTDRALHKVRRALALQPNQSDAIEVRERLVNEEDVWPTGSILDEVIRNDAEELEHNILQHGWKGARDRLSAAPSSTEPVTREAGSPNRAHNRAQNRAPNRAAASHAPKNASSGRLTPLNNGGNDSALADEWWSSPEFLTFMETWNTELAREQGRNPSSTEQWWTTAEFINFLKAYETNALADSWWNSPEYHTFMETWDAELAREQNRAPSTGDTWWTSPQFVAFLQAYQSAALADASAGTTNGATTTTAATNSGTLTNRNSAGATTNDGRIPVSADNPYVYYPSEADVPANQDAATTSTASGETATGSDTSTENGSTQSYTEVDEDHRD
ncbi:MAG TPA: hypothetical protein VFF69_13195 [Phycisphaerales bacterium]|nr:hypothetical protein [Phycisphaerales bacterium]